MTLTDRIKAYGLDIGYHHVGVTTAEPFDDHYATVDSRGDTYDFYIQDPRQFMKGAKPRDVMPEAKSIVCMVWDYAQKAFPANLVGKIGRIYQARCYGPPAHRINGARYQLMVDFLKQAGCRVGHGFFLPERRAAARAGIAAFGKNNFAYAKGCGSFVVLSSIVVDKELAFDTPTMKVFCPDNCTACMDACPTNAIEAPLKLNPRRCIAFNNWWTQDGRPPDITGRVPYEIRERMGVRVHGCDACQEACPRNHARMSMTLPKDPFLENIANGFNLEKMLSMPDEFYSHHVQPIMYNYINEKQYFQRNAAIAMGNAGDPTFVPHLARAMSNAHQWVRSHAAWALGKIGGQGALSALSRALASETDSAVCEEIQRALSHAASP